MVSEEQLREIIEKHGYRLRKVVRFKHKDRIDIEKPGRYTVTLYLNCKLEELEPLDIPNFLGFGDTMWDKSMKIAETIRKVIE